MGGPERDSAVKKSLEQFSTVAAELEEELRSARSERDLALRLLSIQRDMALQLSMAADPERAVAIILDAMLALNGYNMGGIYLRRKEKFVLAVFCGPDNLSNRINRNLEAKKIIQSLQDYRPIYGNEWSFNWNTDLEPLTRSFALIPILHDTSVSAIAILIASKMHEVPDMIRRTVEGISHQLGAIIVHLQYLDHIRVEQEQYRAMANALDEAVAITSDNEIITCNNAMAELVKYPVAELTGMDIRNIFGVTSTHTDPTAVLCDVYESTGKTVRVMLKRRSYISSEYGPCVIHMAHEFRYR